MVKDWYVAVSKPLLGPTVLASCGSISSAIEIVSSMTVSTAMMRVLCKLRNQMERIPSQLRNTITVVLYLKTLERDKLFTVRQLATFVEPKQQPMLTTFTDSWAR